MRTELSPWTGQGRAVAIPTEAFLDAIPVHAVVLDSAGRVLTQNQRWRELWPDWAECPFALLRPGESYIDVWLRMPPAAAYGDIERICTAVNGVLAGTLGRQTVQVRGVGPGSGRCLDVHVERAGTDDGRTVVSHARAGGPDPGLVAHTQRVASIGELAGSLAHEVNQPLMAIQANAAAAEKLLSEDPADIAEALAAVRDIADDCRRAATIVQRIRAFLRNGPSTRERIDMRELTLETLRLLRGEAMRQGVRIETGLTRRPAICEGDAIQFQQALLNLVRNGMQAMSHLALPERELHVCIAEIPEHRILIAVRDSGDGIPPAHLPRIFDPFFTTRPGGLGMGLSITRSIVDSLGGEVRARNHESGRGAVFEIVLPVAGC